MKYLANLELELENLASKIICGTIFPKEYIDIVSYFSKIELVTVSNEISDILVMLQKKLSSASGLMKAPQLENYVYGKNPELLQLVQQLHSQVTIWIPLYTQAYVEKGDEITQELDEKLQGQDYVGMGDAITGIQSRKDEWENIHLTNLELQKLKANLDSLLSGYGSFLRKIPKKNLKPSLDKSYQIFINDLVNNMELAACTLELSIVLGRVIQALQAIFPKTEILDPYATQISENILKILASPENFYTDCKMDRILNDTVATIFHSCYPEFYQIYYNLFLEDYEKMNYDQQLIFRRSFAIPEDNSQLLNLTQTYINIGYTT